MKDFMLEWSIHTVMSDSDEEHEYSSLSPIVFYAVSVSDIYPVLIYILIPSLTIWYNTT